MYPFSLIQTATYLSSLPSDNEELLSTYAPSFMMSHDPPSTHHTTHHSSSHHSSSSTSSSSSSINQTTHPLSIVLYVLCDSLFLSSNNNNHQNQNERLRSFHILHALSEMLMDEGIPECIRNKLLLQLVDPKELLGPSSGRCGQLRSLAFSVYSRCRPAFNHLNRARSLTSFGPTAERENKKVCVIIAKLLFYMHLSCLSNRTIVIVKCLRHLSSCLLIPLSLEVVQSLVHRFIPSCLILMKLFSSVAIVSLRINVGCWLCAVTDKESCLTRLSLEYHILQVMSKYIHVL